MLLRTQDFPVRLPAQGMTHPLRCFRQTAEGMSALRPGGNHCRSFKLSRLTARIVKAILQYSSSVKTIPVPNLRALFRPHLRGATKCVASQRTTDYNHFSEMLRITCKTTVDAS
jgi:hypothetical protein